MLLISDHKKMYVKLPRKCHNQEAQPSQGIKKGETRNKNNDKTNATYETTEAQTKNCNGRTALGRSVEKNNKNYLV